jgi:hypothetical protein
MKKHLTPAVIITALSLVLTASHTSHASGAVKPKPPKPAKAPKAPAAPKPPKVPPVPSGTITITNKTWVCDGPVNLDSLTVTITEAMASDRSNSDGVHLRPGCTGRIGRLVVTDSAGDAVKVAEGVHDLTVAGGTIRCPAKAPKLHQDGVQVMGGQRITFQNMSIDCGRQADSLIDSNFFVNRAGQSMTAPSDVVCDGCTLGGWTAHTINIEESLRSGVRNSTLCVGRFPKLTTTFGAGAVAPVNTGNRITTC